MINEKIVLVPLRKLYVWSTTPFAPFIVVSSVSLNVRFYSIGPMMQMHLGTYEFLTFSFLPNCIY